MKVTSNSQSNIDLIVGVKNGVAQTKSLKPGETRDDIEIDVKDVRNAAFIHAGAITVTGAKADAATAAIADPAPTKKGA